MKKLILSILIFGTIALAVLVRSPEQNLKTNERLAKQVTPASEPSAEETPKEVRDFVKPQERESSDRVVLVEDDRPTENLAQREEGAVLRIRETLAEATLSAIETKVLPEVEADATQTRLSLIETSLKYPFMIVEEKGKFFNQPDEVVESVRAQVATHFMLQIRPEANLVALQERLKSIGCSIGEKVAEDNFMVDLDRNPSIDEHLAIKEAIRELNDFVEVVEPDYYVYAIKTPNDSRLLELWGMHNTGQTGGTNDKDIDGPEAWELQTGSKDVLVGVIDTGIDRNHEDLHANMWTNPNEIPGNGKDDDGNGYVDDVHGWDFHNNDNNPHDDNAHGTHCAGTIGGNGNNGKGVVGVCWNVSMVGIKFLGRSGGGYLSDGVKSISYATKIGVRVTSNSWGGGGYSSSMKKAIDEAAKKGIGFVAAAGNHSGNNDKYPSYPASYDSENVISVGAHDHKGKSAYFSCYGKTSVDLFAPGVNVLSSTPGNRYASYNGTSMATPHVAGAYALVLSANPGWKVSQVKDALMNGVDSEESLKEKCLTGGRLNVFQALSNEPPKKKLIAASPASLDFGKVRLGESKTLELVISNPGTEETTITTTAVAKEITRPENLIGHWTFDEGSGTTAANTGTRGNTYKATLLSGATFSTKEKKRGAGSLHIPTTQTSAQARVGNPLKLGNGSYRGETFSISAWFKKLYPNHYWRTLSRGSSYGHHLIVGYRNDSVGVYANGNGDWRDSGEFDMPAKNFQDNWNHIVAVSNKTTNRTQFYLNGLYKGDSDRATGQNIYAIGNYHGGNQRFAEYLDDFRVYDVTLSAEEVKGIFNEEKADTPFRFSLQTPVKLAPGKGVKATVTFSGAEKGKHAGNLLIVSDATNNPALNVPLSVEVTAFPKLVLSEDSLHFGLNQDEIEEKPLTLSNVGDADLTYEIIVSKNADGPNFSNGLRAMGYNRYGELGDGTKTQRTKPVQVEDKGIKEVAAGGQHSLFLKENGSLWAMGYNGNGQLGDGTRTHRSKPVQVVNGGVKAVAAGWHHSLFLKEDGSLWAMGYNSYGQLGDGTRTQRTKPFQVVNGGVKAVAADLYHSLFLKEDGSLWAMGRNNYGELGDGTRTLRTKPVQIVNGGVKAVAAGLYHSLFLKEDGSLWAMGRNYYGELGDGTTSQRTKPVQVVNGGVKAVAGGRYHSLFVKEGGSLWAMGYNSYGQLGDGTTTRCRTRPVQVVNGGVKAVDGGHYYHSLFVKEDGSLWAMGYNRNGQLGDGTTTQRTKPVQVEADGIKAVAGGYNHSLFLKADGSPKTPEWLTIDQGKGKLSAGKQARIQVRANAGKISEPYVTAYLHLSSNDHEEPKRKIRVTVERLSNDGGLTFRPYSLKFDETYVGQTAEGAIEITNSKTEAITIRSFTFRDSAFSHRMELPITLKAGEKVVASVYFTPDAAGKIESSALLLTDEKGGKSRTLKTSGIASLAPSIAVNPASVSQTLAMNEERKVTLAIRNSGGSVLNWALKGATGLGGKSFSLGTVFSQEHFAAMAKGTTDERRGAPISMLGGGPDFHGYSWSDSKDAAGPDHEWTDISKNGKLLSELSDKDDGFAKVALPFSVEFYGKEYKEAFVNANGYLTFEKGAEDHGHFPLPTPMMPGNLVTPFAMDLNLARGGNVYVHSAGNEFVVQYDKVKDFAGLGEYTFQISLNRNGVIHFHYHKMDGPTNRATTGIQNASADVGLLVAYNNAQIQSNMSVRISTSPKWLHTSKIAGSLEGGKSESVQLTLKSGGIAAGKYEAQMEITSNDPARAKITIPVSLAIEATRTLSVTPANVDFGEVKVGTSGKVALKLSNTGNAPISLSQLAISSDAFNANFQKIELEPGQSELVDLKFHPEEGKEYKGTATISSNARQSSLELRLRGQGLATPKLRINPESVRITVEAGQKASERAVLDNLEGLAKGTFELKEIRAEGTGKSKARFDEKGKLAGESVPEDPFAAKHAPNQLIVSFKTGKTSFENVGKLGGGFSIERPLGMARKPGNAGRALSSLSLVLVKVDQNASLRDLANRLSKDSAVDYVEPNYILRHTETPNDPNWKDQWALPKIEATKAWQITKGAASVVVAVIDTGIDYNHPDLQGNIWKNPGEIANNGKDDDGNGFIDDVYGWDFCNKDNDPMDGNRHGTHVAGTIAAATNNGKQVAGVAWQAKLVGVKFLSDRGSGSTADAIDSIAYCAAMNFPISNNSWGGGGYSKALKEVIGKAGDKGHLFCAAAGNSGTNNDQRPHYPSNYDCPSIISVAASDSSDKLAYFSCYGKTTVDLAAPGVNILNLAPNGGTARLSGTSMATPHVAGAAALVLSQNPSAGHQELKKILIDTVDPIDAFAGKMVAGGRLNLFKAVEVSGSTWLSVSPKQGTVEAGKSVNLGFAVDATKLTAGTKKAIVAYKTNDPLAQTIEVSVNLTVTGTPKIEVDEDAIAFGEVWVGKEAKRALVIRNIGTDILKISALKFGHAAFSSKTGALSVNPGTEETLEILGKPSASEQISTSLEIASNDPNKAKVSVKLEMQAVQPPSLSFQPDLVALTLEPGKKGEETITIANSGEAMGVWKAQLVETNKKRTRSRDMAGILSGLNAEGRAPDFYDPGLPTISAGLMIKDEDGSYATREDGGNPEALEVAVLGADHQRFLDDLRKGLVETKRFSGVTSINVRNLTPTLKELEAFDALIVYNNYRYKNNKALGDNLADYADNGKGVVTMVFESSIKYLPSLTGRWNEGKYGVFDTTNQDTRNWADLGKINQPNHPLLNDCNTFKGYYRLNKKGVRNHSKIIAEWSDGLPLIASRADKDNIVGINFFPASKRVWRNGWETSTDGWKIMANALEWSVRGGSPDWISGTPLEGTVEGEKEGSMALKFNATGLDEGNYTAEVQFSSNDPENAYHAVKVILTVRDNQPPVALPATVTVQEDASVAFTLKGEDADGDKLTYEVVGRPKNGALAGETPELTYTPKANFNGDDELTFKVSDGRNESAVARITFKVEAVNDAPWAQSQEVNATEDEFITIAFKYGDPDGDNLALILTQEPNHGFLWEESGEWLYIPNNHFNGRDLIKYKVSDGKLTSKEATITLNLDPANDAPVASDIKVVTDENMAVNVELNATDVDGDRLTYAISTEPKHGTLTSAGNNRWTYQPFNRYAGGDAFTYRAFDGKSQGNLATVSIEVKKVNNPPVVQASTFSLEEDGKLPIKLIASDPDGDDLTFTITRNPNNGSLSGNGPSYVYTPSKDFNGQDSFQVMANDGKLESNATTITLNVEGKNDAPRFESLVGTLQTSYRETPMVVPLRATDVDGQELVFNMSEKPANGECVIRDNELIYYPAIGFTGQDEMEVEVSDGQLSDKKTLILSVAEHPNAIPIHLEESDSSELVTAFQNLIYEMNDRLVKSEDFLLKLETTASDSNSLTDPDEEAVRKIEIKLSDESVETSELTMESWIASLKDIQGTERFAFHPTSAEQAEKWMIASLLDSESSADTDVNIEDTYNNEDLDSSTTEDTPESDPSQADSDENEKDKTSEGSTGVEEDFAEATLEDPSIEESPKTEEKAAQEDKQSKTEKKTAVVIAPVTTDEETSSSNNADEQEEEIASGKEEEKRTEAGKTSDSRQNQIDTMADLVKRGEIPHAIAYSEAPGWYRIESLGDFFDAGNGWIFQPELGWSYTVALQGDSSWWLFNANTGWLWFKPELTNSAFATGTLADGWVYFNGKSLSETEAFYSYSSQEWYSWKR